MCSAAKRKRNGTERENEKGDSSRKEKESEILNKIKNSDEAGPKLEPDLSCKTCLFRHNGNLAALYIHVDIF